MNDLDLFASVAGPYTAGSTVPILPAPALPTTPTPAAPPPAPAPPAGAPAAPVLGPPVWWQVEHRNSDGEPHTYCGPCFGRIPDFLVSRSTKLEDGDVRPAPARCEGCGASPDLTAQTVEVLNALLEQVNSAEPHPAKDASGDTLTAACLEYARECVVLCAAARGTLDA